MSFPSTRLTCSICTQLSDYHHGFQKGGHEDEDVFLPSAAGSLKDIRELEPVNCRHMVLEQCPECGTCYLYQSDYEFLVSGTEDEQTLSRLTDEEARRYLEQG